MKGLSNFIFGLVLSFGFLIGALAFSTLTSVTSPHIDVAQASQVAAAVSTTPTPPGPPAPPPGPTPTPTPPAQEKKPACDKNADPQNFLDCCNQNKGDAACVQAGAVLAEVAGTNCDQGNIIDKLGCLISSIGSFFTTGMQNLVQNLVLNVQKVALGAFGIPIDCSNINNSQFNCSKLKAYIDYAGHHPEAALQPGVLSMVSNYTVALAENPPPVHVGDYLASVHPLGTPAQAVDCSDSPGGTCILKQSGIIALWQAVRDAAYILSVIIIVVLGLMIMFRRQIDPRTVVTVANSLPRIVFALILITFSYAIAGLILDVTAIAGGLINSIFTAAAANQPANLAQNFDLASLLAGGLVTGIVGAAALAFLSPTAPFVLIAFGFLLLLFGLIILGLFLYLGIKLTIRYARFFIQVALAPLYFLYGSLPGQEEVTVNWFKSALVNTLSFPVVVFFLKLAAFFVSTDIPLPADLGGVGFFGIISKLVAFAILWEATKVPEMLEHAFDVIPAGHVAKAGTSAGAMLKTITSIGAR